MLLSSLASSLVLPSSPMAASSSSNSLALLFSLKSKGTELSNAHTLNYRSKHFNLPVLSLSQLPSQIGSRHDRSSRIVCSVSVSSPGIGTETPEELVASILSKVSWSDGGVKLSNEEHEQVSEVAQQLQRYCVAEPVRCPLIFGEWDVVYCSRPTSPGGGYRSAFGRLFFKTKEMIQDVEAPDTIRNKVAFSLFGFLDGEVSLKGKLIALDESWIQVIFEAPQLKVGALELQYGGQSEVKLQITYIDDNIRLGKGSRGSLFVFQRRE